jgi:hypothetical protein
MSNIWDSFSPISGFILWRDGQRRTNTQRRNARLQLEQLEQREVPSADASAGPPIVNQSQFYQQLLQAEAHPTATQAPFLEQSLTAAALVLPTFSGFLNTASNYMTAAMGPQTGQQYMQAGIQQVNTFLLNLEDATLAALNTTGSFQDATFLSDVSAINAFMSNPLNYTPPS